MTHGGQHILCNDRLDTVHGQFLLDPTDLVGDGAGLRPERDDGHRMHLADHSVVAHGGDDLHDPARYPVDAEAVVERGQVGHAVEEGQDHRIVAHYGGDLLHHGRECAALTATITSSRVCPDPRR